MGAIITPEAGPEAGEGAGGVKPRPPGPTAGEGQHRIAHWLLGPSESPLCVLYYKAHGPEPLWENREREFITMIYLHGFLPRTRDFHTLIIP